MKKPILVAIILWAVVVILAIELTFKINSEYQVSGIAYDEILGWRFKRNMNNGFFRKKDGFTTNNEGFRDNEHPFVKDKGIKRIIFLGDSYTAGSRVSDHETFSSLFRKKIAANKTDSNKYDVMNVSVPAWATDQEFLYLVHEGMKYKPDYLFLMIAPNDIRETYAKSFFRLDNNNYLEKGRTTSISLKARFCWFLSNNSCFYQFLQMKVFKTSHGGFSTIFSYFPVDLHVTNCPTVDHPLFLMEMPAQIKAARDLFKTIVLEINKACLKNNCKLILVVLPTKMEFDGSLNGDSYQPGNIAHFVRRISLEHGIIFLDLFSLLNTEADPLKVFIADEYHYNREGHIFIAEKLYEFFDQLKLLLALKESSVKGKP